MNHPSQTLNIYKSTILVICISIFIGVCFDLSLTFLYAFILVLSAFAIISQKYLIISQKELHVILPFLLLVFIDKIYNDFIYNSEGIKAWFVLLYVFVFYIFLFRVRYKYGQLLWKVLYYISLCVPPISFLIAPQLSDLNREVSSFVFFCFFYSFYYRKKYRLLIFIYSFSFSCILCENRTVLLMYVVFLLANKLFVYASHKKIIRFIPLLFILTFLLIGLGICTEFFFKDATIFTNRGVLWMSYLGAIFNSDNISTYLLGLTNSPKYIEEIMFNYGISGYMDRYPELFAMNHPHNGIVNIIFNSGLVGFNCFILFLCRSLKNINYNRLNFVLFLCFYVSFLFYGRSIFTPITSSIMIIFSLIVPLPEIYNKTQIKKYENLSYNRCAS